MRQYESHSAWPAALQTAGNRWRVELEVRARAALFRDLNNDGRGVLALRVLERIDERLAPAKLRHELFGKGGGGAIRITTVKHDVSAAREDDK